MTNLTNEQKANEIYQSLLYSIQSTQAALNCTLGWLRDFLNIEKKKESPILEIIEQTTKMLEELQQLDTKILENLKKTLSL